VISLMYKLYIVRPCTFVGLVYGFVFWREEIIDFCESAVGQLVLFVSLW